MAKKVTKRDFDRDLKKELDLQNHLNNLKEKEFDGLSNVFNINSRINKLALEKLKIQNELNESINKYAELKKQVENNEVSVGETTMENIKNEQVEHQKTINKLEKKKAILVSIKNIGFKGIIAEIEKIGTAFNDKPIREAALSLGLGAEKAQLIRDAFYKAAPQAQILGANMADLATIQTSYADESGRALAMTSEQLVNVAEIAKGTGLATSEAGRLAAQFELLGMDTRHTHETIQGIVDSSERMGVNSQKVIKTIGDNFKKLNTFAFKDGIKGMAKMAQYSEKFKIDINASINSAEQARTLDGAIKMASELQVLGGEFAKADPFEMFHLSRNDPAKYTQRINEMVKGMSSLVKTADGFKMETSPQDLDRLKLAAEAMGVPFENLVEQSQRMGEIQAMNRQMMGNSFSKEDREAIQSMAKLDTKTGIYTVLGKDISKLSAKEVESLKVQQKTLKERSEAAQTFDEKFQNTIESMKLTLIPILDGINYMFDLFHPVIKGISEAMQGLPSWGKTSLAVVGGITGAVLIGAKSLSVLKSLPIMGLLPKLLKGGGATSIAKDAVEGTAKSAVGSAGGGAGGMAALGKGAGVGIAASGIAKLADAFKQLNVDQLNGVNEALKTMGWTLLPFAVGLTAVAFAGKIAVQPLLAFGGAALMIGAGIGIAAAGIGYMAKGFSELMTTAEPSKMFQLALGIGALSLAMAGFSSAGIISLIAGGGSLLMLNSIASKAGAFDTISKSMKDIAVVMNSDGKGLLALKETLDTISNSKSSGGMLGELKDIIKNGIKVEFKDKNVALNVDITTKIDSDVVARSVAKKIVVLHKEYQEGKSGK